ncbi:SIS domain-containing protein [Magnetospira sp. QH-2]|uniref:D-sedoheptulose-7-phosphate isomerase n=1 Tax=Magnetospira sp. (strain QH-2) TaxID=1288970 RepID=UPI0003E80B94|nr:SIS domain-containing protein [Magnetospira sp. QH-2]CCQ72091.1 Phosphoheptose isomerase [Magnetospira sp. QH-2]
MTFPDDSYADIASYFDAYADRLAHALKSIDRSKLDQAGQRLAAAYENGGRLYVCGNGGSAAIADSFVGDHAKLVQSDTHLKPRIISLSSNIPMLTAIANDLSYDDVFLYPLRSDARPGDLLLVISSSGNSENVVRAAQWARDNEIDVIAFTGFTGGRLAGIATHHLHVEADNYGVIEDSHQSLMHVLAQYIRMANMDPALIAERLF